MTINADGSHAVQPHTANAHTAPTRPVRHAVVEEEVLEPLRPVDGWGFTNRVILVSVLVVIIGDVVRVLTGGLGDPNGSVALQVVDARFGDETGGKSGVCGAPGEIRLVVSPSK